MPELYEEKKKSWIGRIITYAFFAVGIFIVSAIIFRSYKMSDIPVCDDVIFDRATYQAYEENPKDFKVYTYGLRKRFESVAGNKLLQLKYMYYIPSTKQMQVSVKYSTDYAELATDEHLPLELVLKNEKGDILPDYFYEYGSKYDYGYIRICWNGAEITDASEYTLYIYLPVENEESELIGKFTLQDAHSAYREIELNKDNAPAIFTNK